MILPDVNVFLNALHAGSPFHREAKAWMEAALVAEEAIALWDVSLVAVYRILTNPKLGSEFSEPKKALAAIERFRSAPAAVTITPGKQFWEIYSELAVEDNIRGPLACDAMLAALALEHRCRVATYDQDFGRFPGLKTFAPKP